MNEQESNECCSDPYECWKELKGELASAQATCSKLHDLNHMQAQQIEVLKAQCETRAKRCYELEQERIALCEANKELAKRLLSFEQEVSEIAIGLGG